MISDKRHRTPLCSRFQIWSLVVAILCAAARPAWSVSRSTAGWGAALDAARVVLRNGRYAEAERRADSLLVAAPRAIGGDSLQVASALDIVVESRLWQGKYRDPRTRLLAERAYAIRTRLQPR